jgi:hypothetical protein
MKECEGGLVENYTLSSHQYYCPLLSLYLVSFTQQHLTLMLVTASFKSVIGHDLLKNSSGIEKTDLISALAHA